MGVGRLIVFEGVDGAGKTTALHRVARTLTDAGVSVFLPRVGKEHASRPTRMIRQLTRDPRNLDLSPRAELLLYCAREAQVLAELAQPALARGDTVLVDRSFLTPVVLGLARGLSLEECEATTQLASAGVKADLTLVFDVHPRTSRLRKRLEKVRTRAITDSGRKGLAGSAFKERVRDGYARLAAERGYPVFHVERATPDELAARVTNVVLQGPSALVETELDRTPRWLVPSDWDFARALASLPLPEALYFSESLIAARELRRQAVATEPALVGYCLDAEDPAREALFAQHPSDALHGWHGRPLEGPQDLRLRGLANAPGAALMALRYVRDAQSDKLRQQYLTLEPDAVLSSLAGREDELAWSLRETGWKRAGDLARTATLVGCSSERSWLLRESLFERSPACGLESLRGTTSARGDATLERHLDSAPKLVLSAIAGRSDAAAYRLRDALFETGREVIDSIRRLGDDHAFALRERALSRWPSTVVHSLLGLQQSPRVNDMLQRASGLGVGDMHLQRRLALLAEQAAAPKWATARASQVLSESLAETSD